MSTSTVTSKGQITIPADVRTELGLVAGTKVEFVRGHDGQYRIVPKTRSLRDLKGSLPAPGRAVTLSQMEAAIAAGAADFLR